MKNLQDSQLTYIAYYRKSTESDERQVQSIPDQKDWASKVVIEQQLVIATHHEESRSARTLGRPMFEEVMQALEEGKADALIAYDASRLARNAMDGARIINLLDTGKLRLIVTSTSVFRNTSTDKFMLAFFFAQSKHYVDNLSELTLRGMRSKAAKGIYPSRAKMGYMNHPRSKEIIPDPVTFPLIKKAYELYVTNRYGLRDMTKLLFDLGLRAPRTGKMLCKHQVVDILSDPFYYGVFNWAGETYEGIHLPAVSKELWDRVARVRQGRSRAQAHWKREFPFLGLIRCAECGGSITAESHTKQYKNGNSQTWHYYRCTKKSGTVKCEQPFIREELLSEQMAENIRVLALPENEDWILPMMRQLDAWEVEEASREGAQIGELKIELEKIAARLRRLTDLHLDGEIERSEYSSRRRVLINEKIASETRLKLVSQEGALAWLEPLRKLLNAVRERSIPTAGGDLMELRNFVAEVGSNLTLNSRKVLWDWNSPYALLAERGSYGNWQP